MLRIVFMGSPEFAVPSLSEIVANGHDVVAVYSQPPSRGGRGMKEHKSPVHEFAEASGLDVRTPATLRADAVQDELCGDRADVAVVAAYGLLLPKAVLEAPVHGCLNLHPSLLPRWRGAAPIQRAIMAGDSETGVMVMRMDQGLDTGPICLAERVGVGENMTAGELHDELARRGADLVVRALAALERGSLECSPQNENEATYAAKIEKAEARIDWSRPAGEVHNHIRGLSPFPGAWFEAMREGGVRERVKVLMCERVRGEGPPGTVLDERLTVACGEGAVRLVRLQRAGKQAARAEEFLRGFAVTSGSVFA